VALIVARYLQYVSIPKMPMLTQHVAGGDMMLELFICFCS